MDQNLIKQQLTTNCHKKLSLTLLLLFMFGIGTNQLLAQNYYVFYNGTYGYITNSTENSVIPSTTFSSAAVWNASGTLGNTNRTLESYVNSTQKLVGASDNLTTGATSSNWRSSNGNLCWRNTYTYYVKYSGTSWNLSSTNNTGNRFTVYDVTKTDYDADITTPLAITGPVISSEGTFIFGHTNAAGIAAYTNFYFNNGNHYVDGNGNNLSSVPTSATYDNYSWSVSSNSYATINSSTGELTITSLPASQVTLTITCTGSRAGLPDLVKTQTVYLSSSGNLTLNGNYIIASGTTHYLGGTSTNDNSTFSPATCLWTGTSGGTWQNSAGYYLRYANNTLSLNATTGTDWTLGDSESGTDGYSLSGSSRYLRYNSGWTTTGTYNNRGRVVFAVTENIYAEQATSPTISGPTTISETSASAGTFTKTNAAFTAGYYNYVFRNNANHYFASDNSTAIDAAPTAETFTYTWSLEGIDSQYAEINSSTGVINYKSYVSSDVQATVKLTATSTHKTFVVTQNVTFEAPKANPTNITASISPSTIYMGSDAQIYYTLTPNPCYDDVTFSSNNTNIVTVDNNGLVSSVSVGQTTITVTAHKFNDASTLTFNVTVTVKDKVATPVISFEPIDDGTQATTTITCATEDVSIYYTVNGDDPTASRTLYVEPFTVDEYDVVKAIAVNTGSSAIYWDNSSIETQTYFKCSSATPVIDIDNTGITFSSTDADANFYYTTNGSDPTTSSTLWDGTPITGLSNETTIKVMAKIESCQPSEIVSRTYYAQSGIIGGTVLLNDLEDHSWAYYLPNGGMDSSYDYPENLCSPYPRNVKITYYGNGTNTVTTSSDATPAANTFTASTNDAVAVSRYETEGTFIYLKTLERDANNRFPYELIPNPFSKRPVYGTNNDTKWRGFYKWRVKSISGGALYTASTGGTAIAVGDMLDAETTYYFQPNDNSMTNANNASSMAIELEALWARAYRVTSTAANVNDNTASSSFLATSCERNFVVVTSGTSNTNLTNNNAKPCTVTMIEPDGSTDYRTTSIYLNPSYVMAQNDLKFEWINLRGGNTYSANGHYFVIGRGILRNGASHTAGNGNYGTTETDLTTSYVNGLGNGTSNGSTTYSSPLDYKLRIESGVYQEIGYLAAQQGRYGMTSSTVHVYGVYGNDYDRAIGNNARLLSKGTYNGIANNAIPAVCFGDNNAGTTTDNHNNYNRETFFLNIKSGDIACATLADYPNYVPGNSGLYLGISRGTARTCGNRRILFEGGKAISITGGMDRTATNSTAQADNDVETVVMRIRGTAEITTAAFGGASRMPTYGNRTLIYTGGFVHGWTATGCNGDAQEQGQNYGTGFMYVGGNTRIGDGALGLINRTERGIVMGAGNGRSDSETTGQMTYGSRVVIADNADIENTVYGGGNYGYTLTTAKVFILGGTVHGSVFGGSLQKRGDDAEIYMTNGFVKGGIYGGSNQSGILSGGATIHIDGGQVGTSSEHANIHGGGYGEPTQVNQNVLIYIGRPNTTGATIFGDVYGGSALGKVNGTAANTDYSTSVTFNAGTLTGDLYGGALGSNSVVANVFGPVTVNVNGGTINGRVFGCNNINGAPQRTVNVNMTNGTVNGSVYGGANLAAYAYTTGPVITMTGGTITNNLFGSGLGEDATVSGNTSITISGTSSIGNNVYGGGENGDVNRNTTIVMSSGKVTNNVFGAGYGITALVQGNTSVTVTGTANVGNNVYGGGENGDVNGNTSVTISGQETKVSVNDVYGAGYGTDSNIAGLTDVHIDGGKIRGSVFGGGEMGHADSYATVTMTDGRVKGDIYGGAKGESGQGVLVDGLKTVNILGGTVETNVYGGSRSVSDTHPAGNNYSSFVNISGGTVDRNVYGGGFYGSINGSVAVMIGKNVIENHNVITPSNVKRGTHTIAPLTITGNIYAGSNWGTFTGGDFGAPNIEGRSDIFVDGTGYDMTFDNGFSGDYMNINKSIYGAGTSTDAGKLGRKIVVHNYGLPTTEVMTYNPNDTVSETQTVLKSSTRSLRSIQRCDELVISDSHIDFKGQGDMTSNITTEIYAIINVFDVMHMVNGSSVIIDFPIDNITKLESDTLLTSTLYTASPNYVVINTDDNGHFAFENSGHQLVTTNVPENTFRINNGTFLNMRYKASSTFKYGELSGFFRIVTPDDETRNFAFSRIKITSATESNPGGKDYPIQNTGDGGFLSYFDLINNFEDNGDTYTSGLQHPYTNQLESRGDTDEFRYWSFSIDASSFESNREGVMIAQTTTENKKYLTSDCVIPLPAVCDEDSYFVISALDWGVDVFASDTAATDPNATTFMDWHDIVGDQPGAFTYGITTLNGNHISDIDHLPDLAFGLVAIPSGGLEGGNNHTMLLSDNSLELVQMDSIFIQDITMRPELRLRLTYSNSLTLNNSLSPFFITVDQYCKQGDKYVLHDRTSTEVTITTATHIPQNLETNIYDLAFGDNPNPYDYTRTITLPIFNLTEGNVYNVFKVTDIVMDAGAQSILNPYGTATSEISDLSMLFGAADNPDDQNGWLEPEHELIDVVGATLPYTLGTADGRSMFSMDFQLFFDGSYLNPGPNNQQIGTVTFTIKQYNADESEELSTFTVKLNIVVRNSRIDWYLDGIHGENRYNGHWPDAAKRTLGGIYNADYVPGDNIWAVDTTDIRYTSEWSSRAYNSVTIRRYPGGVSLFRYDPAHEHEYYYNDYLEEYNPTNECYAGPILYLDGGTFTLKGIILDGSNDLSTGSGVPNEPSSLNSGSKPGAATVDAISPLVYLQREEGEHQGNGIFIMTNSSVLQNNTNAATDAGGVYVSDGTECVVMGGSKIIDNIVYGEHGEKAVDNEGGGVYVECGGKLTVAQKVTITDNEAHLVTNDVFLEGGCEDDLTINVGYEVDEILTGLEEGSQIGVTKDIPEGEYYTPIAYSTRPGYIEDAEDYFFDDRELYGVLYSTEEPFKSYHAYFVDTWVTAVRTMPEGWSLNSIDSEEDLAWLISYVNGYNGSTAHPDAVATMKADVDMGAHVWVPIGASSEVPFTGTFDGQAHTIDNLIAPFKITDNLGMFGYVEDAEIKGVFVTSCDYDASPDYLGVVVGELHNSDLYYSEGAGSIKGGSTTIAMGGLVGLVDNSDVHSSMAMATMEGDSHLGGLVGELSSGSTVKNVFTNGVYKFTGETDKYVGGLVGDNKGTVDNGYIRSLRTGSNAAATALFKSFSGNDAAVTHCYDDEDYTATSTPYMYKHKDNMIGTHKMTDTLNKFVSGTLAPWTRSSANFINNDYPILMLPYNAMGSEDSIVLKYGTLTTMIARANAAENGATLFMYRDEDIDDAMTDDDVDIYIQEDVSLLNSADSLRAYVGITVGNYATDSVYDHNGVAQKADWHILSSPLMDAPLGIDYGGDNTQYGYWDDPEHSQLPHFPFYEESVKDGYFPSREFGQDYVDDEYPYTYDYYHFYEPQYHWINFKRNSASHYHEDGTHLSIAYTNEETLIPARGYLITIDTATFMQSHGHLNNGKVSIPITRNGYYLTGCNMIGTLTRATSTSMP